MGGGGGGEVLFETRRGGIVGMGYKMIGSSVFVGICLIWFYRLLQIITIFMSPAAADDDDDDHEALAGRGMLSRTMMMMMRSSSSSSSSSSSWGWNIGMMFMAELWFGLYWILTLSARWNVVSRSPFLHTFLRRYGEKLPAVDIFVCTADPKIEPATMVMGTVLSAMAYNYPPEKLSVYVSDDGASDVTFYALLEASRFSKHWLPFCNKFAVEPRSPAAYFARNSDPHELTFAQEWLGIKKLYEEMNSRIKSAMKMGSISKEIRDEHRGFSEWDGIITKQDHQSIVQIIIDGRDKKEVDDDGRRLPTLVYVAREKRPQWPHHFKAGAINALIRVSSEISNGPIILTLDCDMYSNNSTTIQEALCFFMDKNRGKQISYVQFPQSFENLTQNDIYSSSYLVAQKIEFAGLDRLDVMLYCGTGCFHRRESLCGGKYSEDCVLDLNSINYQTHDKNVKRNVGDLEEASKALISCSYEMGTTWGKEMGLVYGFSVEDLVTGLAIQCRGWKPVYYNPERKAFVGLAPTTLAQSLVQHKRWAEGLFQIFCSRYCPFFCGPGKIKLGAQMGYCIYLLFAPTSLPTIYYVTIPSLCLLHGIPLFPKVSSPWFLPFAYVVVVKNAGNLWEVLRCGQTPRAWWNSQRMCVIRRTTSFALAFIDTLVKQLGFSETTFAITSKVVDEDALKRYKEEKIEFGSSSLMFVVIATLALLNLFSFVGGVIRVCAEKEFSTFEKMVPQIVLCGALVGINIPIYEALFVRNDKGCMPMLVVFKSIVVASVLCLLFTYN
ncbi:cellulose synthase-like protein E6 [Malania oleifera]|uniref:cellulose synthase-like protein E6 n=1 Tax=Malania oleifera TaxID=397392 RepID=UPI0025ADD4E1|nr:cellulose synthase-like protein E6 [Malania oleifera]